MVIGTGNMAKAGDLSTWDLEDLLVAYDLSPYRTGTFRCTQTLFTIPSPNMTMSANEPL